MNKKRKILMIVIFILMIGALSGIGYYYWYNKDKAFKEAADNTVESQIDIVEASLFKQISEGNTTAIIFFLKTKAKHRGYVERVEQDISSSQPMELNIKIIEGNGKD